MTRSLTEPIEKNYWLRKDVDILRVLDRLYQNKCLLTAFLDAGKSSFITTLVGIDVKHKRLFVDYGPKDYLNAQLLRAGKVLFRTTLSGIRTEFTARDVGGTSVAGQKVFTFPIPDKVLWMERRRFYRVKPPLENLPRCIALIDDKTSEFSILDISISGLALVTEDTSPEFQYENGVIFEDSRIILPDYGEVTASLEIKNHMPCTKISHKEHLRLGCAFRQLQPAFESTIQRYMQMIERKKKRIS